MKNEQVHCPVCRVLWPYTLTSPSGKYTAEVMPVTVPVVGGVTANARNSGGGGGVSGSAMLSVEKAALLVSLREVGRMALFSLSVALVFSYEHDILYSVIL